MGFRRIAGTRCASLSLGACSYTSPVVAPPADIRPPPAAQLEPESPDEEADEALRAFRDAIAAYSEAVRWAEAAQRPRLESLVRLAIVRLGKALDRVPFAHTTAGVSQVAGGLQNDAVWFDVAARYASFRAATEHALRDVASATQARAAGPHRGSCRVSAAVREFRADTALLHPADRVPASDQQILTALRAAERALISLYTALARGE
ncbi:MULTISPECIES: hypothetical protein [Sorangium]|uniref:Uncharacterized protein n=1 Tax=Sorangium cellulosum TaxID=56 RepID=A0A4V0NFB0_SORCE|nr:MULTISPECIES: hypothetical protein [Sorangium]AUX29042.1 uncharacterized protein SOCE836_011270 [Sorangium cellulosum]WCQ88432.1 hypothetical protein NQZ70_01109 [Sorangium sp. Soce836]